MCIFGFMAGRIFTDQLSEQVKLNDSVKRIVSLVPSQTELLYDLGLGDRVVGITKFCVHPIEWRKTKTIVGGTKKFNMDVIGQLEPDLILGNKEENYQEGIDALRLKYPIWMSDIYTLEDAISMIQSVGEITQTENKAMKLVTEIEQTFKDLLPTQTHKVLYLIWKDPWMAVGKNTFIDSMLKKIGLKNVVGVGRYPELSLNEIQALSSEVILLSSEPFPFNQQHIDELQQFMPSSKIILVDGEMFSWYGSRLVKAPDYFRQVVARLR
jgi:ABC-type Fe3+-hydroxamate transport system substrate-binding protein